MTPAKAAGRRLPALVRRLSIVLCIAACGGPARAGSLDQPDDIDLTQLDASTRRLQLLVILDDEHVDSRQAMHALWVKLTRYQRYIVDGRALKDHPAADPRLRPEVVIVAPQEASSAEMQNLAGVKMAYDRRDIPVAVQPYVPGLHARPRRDYP